MAGRTLVLGDIHGELEHLERLWKRLPKLDTDDTVVFLGDYVDRGPDSRGVVAMVRALPGRCPARFVFLFGNHEESWLRVVDDGFLEFVLPPGNGCWPCARSFLGLAEGAEPKPDQARAMIQGSFFPEDVVAWMRTLAYFYEDDHAIYVHAGLPRKKGRFLHPSEVDPPRPLLWLRSEEFFREYRGKRVVCGHTPTEQLPDISLYTPGDNADLWFTRDVIAIDTKCGKPGGFLTAIELPGLGVYESR
jgi:calcineurin-like phosphoesterase family protein